ncbi:putative membrane protein [Halomonas alkaliantarctica]|nr:putative membrane protein [Halomonas alkaliantarctica]
MAFTLHLYASLLALGLGAILLLSPKGTMLHRIMGSTWVLAMAFSALSSFWFGGGVLPLIGHFGPIHLLSLWVLVALAVAVVAILKGRVEQHRGWMVGAYLGLVGAFVGSLAPGRWVAVQLGLW